MPEALTWNETRSPAKPGVRVAFDGPSAPKRRVWIGLFVAAFAAFFVKLTYAQPNPSWARAVPILILCAGIGLMAQGMPGPHSGRIELDGALLRLVPSGLYAIGLKLEVFLVDIEYFTSDSQTSTMEIDSNGGTMTVEEVRFRVYLYRTDGRRHILAMFGEKATAEAMVQSLEGLVTRARAGWFNSPA